MTQGFLSFEILDMPREDNTQADLLAQMANTKGSRFNRKVIQEKIETHNFKEGVVFTLVSKEGWKNPIERYLIHELLPEDQLEARKIK